MKTALLVEDSLTDKDLMMRELQGAGYVVAHAGSAEEALVQLGKSKPDLIVLDVILPGQSGFELCRQLKADPILKGIPVLMCSTKSTDADKMWGSMLGADAYITKPVQTEEFTRALSQLGR